MCQSMTRLSVTHDIRSGGLCGPCWGACLFLGEGGWGAAIENLGEEWWVQPQGFHQIRLQKFPTWQLLARCTPLLSVHWLMAPNQGAEVVCWGLGVLDWHAGSQGLWLSYRSSCGEEERESVSSPLAPPMPVQGPNLSPWPAQRPNTKLVHDWLLARK